MRSGNHTNKVEYYSCHSAKSVMLKFRFSLLKYIFRRKEYPLFAVSSRKGGIIKTYQVQKKLRMNKFVKFNNNFYFSLTVPHWPSKSFDKMVSNGGLNITMGGTDRKRHIDTVILGITRKCKYSCSHCYEHFNIGDEEVIPTIKWHNVISDLQKLGVSIITLSGGEPMMRYIDVLNILRSSNHSLSDFHLHTSGYGVTPAKAIELKRAGLHAAGIGLDDVNPERNDSLRGSKGAFDQAVNSIRYFREAGIFTYVNMCLTRDLINSGQLNEYFELLRELNIGFVRWLEPKTCGGYLDKNANELLNDKERKTVKDFYLRANSSPDFKDYPVISYDAFYEEPENLGCMMAGNSQFYIDSLGNVQPCVFFPVSFGNIMDANINDIIIKMRQLVPQPLKVQCPSVLLGSEIRNLKEKGFPVPVPYEEISSELEILCKECIHSG
jgi:MoaA/NifB/PqqE/SkfB family radical SAM enzyme